jgi:hypothetical protein
LKETTPPLSPGQVPDSDWLSRPLPRWAQALAALMAGLLVVWVLINWSRLHIYQRYFFEQTAPVSVPWERLTPLMDEADVKKLVGRQLICMADPTSMGTRTCYASVHRVNGHRAHTIAFFFARGRLNTAMVQVPSWAHQEARNALIARHGGGGPARDGRGIDLTRWKLPQGIMDMNSHRNWLNPLDGSAIVWMPPGAAPPGYLNH